MSYTALYRKYRPYTFSNVIGQDVTVKILKNSIKENKIGHAYIFCGPRGTGKTSIAKILSRAVNCLNPIDGDACGKCENCKRMHENDTDIIEIDAASNNGVDEIREIRNNAKLMPNIGKYKVYIIDEVHMLSTGAFNALLKTLEEPPAHVIFVLATTEIQKIPLTILSRCQRFDFHKINGVDLKNRLSEILKDEKRTMDDTILDLIVKLSDGCCRDAINLLDQLLSLNSEKITEEDVYNLSGDIDDKKVASLIESIFASDYQKGLKIIKEINDQGKSFNTLINKMLINIRNISLLCSGQLENNEEIKINYNEDVSEENLVEITKLLLELLTEIKKSTMQGLVFEIYFMRMCNIFKRSNENTKIVNPAKKEEKTEKPVKEESADESSKIQADTDIMKHKRVNNTLAKADKGILKELQIKYQNLDEYSSNKSFNNAFSILSEGKIVAASDEYLIISFEYESNVLLFYKNLKEVETLLKQVLETKYKAVAVSEYEWNIIKKDYISNRSKYVYESETKTEKKESTISSTNDELNSAMDIFGEDLVTIN